MIVFFRLTTTLALLIAIAWLFFDPKFDSAFATAIALAAVIALYIAPTKKKRLSNQSQSVTEHSTGIQAGGDVNISTNKIPK